MPQNTVQSILQTSDGYLWFGTEGGLARFDSQRFTVFNSRNTPQLRSNDIRSLLEDSGGTVWIATSDGIASLFHQQFHNYTTANGLPSNSISTLFQDASHHVCASTSAGMACFISGRFEAAIVADPSPHSSVDTNLQRFVASPVLCSYIDREGDTWIGTESSGVTILRKLYFQTFSDRADGLDDQIRCVYRDRSGAIWFGTNSQGLTRYAGDSFTRYTVAQGLSSNVIVSLGEDAFGDLLVGTPDGLNRLHNQRFTVITSSDGLPDDFIRSIHTDSDGTVWLGTRHGLARLRAGKFQTYTHADGLGSDLVGSITRDSSGTLWIATLGGLSSFDGSHFKNRTSGVITALYSDSAGTLWIGKHGGGLSYYLSGSFRRLIHPGLPEVIYGITEDSHHNLWLASDFGVIRFTHPLTDASEAISYGVSDGLRVNECSGGGHPAVARDSDGGIWFATLKGASQLLPDVNFDQVPPPVRIESAMIDNRTIESTSQIEVPPGSNRVVFNYAGLSYSAPQKVEFRYQLHGFDKNWVQADQSRTAFYTNLSPGQYTFQVIARNGDGVWNRQGASIAIHIQPHFYQTWWFALLMLLLLAAAGYGIYQWRLRRVEAAIESRFEAVLGERNRIAREIHDTLAQGFAGISVQLELVSRKLGVSADSAREHLDQARMLVRSSLAEARRSIWELRSQSSEMEDLASRLSKMAAQMGGAGQPKITLLVRGTYRPLPARTEDELLRIAQESVTNAIRHAQASEITIELAFDPQLLRMTISDNGRGFSPTGDTTGISGHFGLKGMRERASGIDAKLKLDTAPGAGTRVSLEVAV